MILEADLDHFAALRARMRSQIIDRKLRRDDVAKAMFTACQRHWINSPLSGNVEPLLWEKLAPNERLDWINLVSALFRGAFG